MLWLYANSWGKNSIILLVTYFLSLLASSVASRRATRIPPALLTNLPGSGFIVLNVCSLSSFANFVHVSTPICNTKHRLHCLVMLGI